MSVLLRQTDGFEGLFLVWKEGEPGDLAVDHGIQHGEGLPDGNAAALSSFFLGYDDEYCTRVEVGKLFYFIVVILERPDSVPHRLGHLFVSVGQVSGGETALPVIRSAPVAPRSRLRRCKMERPGRL